jgi:hypothetical protein
MLKDAWRQGGHQDQASFGPSRGPDQRRGAFGGAAGDIGTQAVKGATNGHTLLMHSTAFCVNPSLWQGNMAATAIAG